MSDTNFGNSKSARQALAAWELAKELANSTALSKRDVFVLGFSDGLIAGLKDASEVLNLQNDKSPEVTTAK